MSLIPSFKKNLYIAQETLLLIPRLLNDCFKDLDGKHFTLRNGRGNTWDVTVELCGEYPYTKVYLTGQWAKFVEDNYIEDDYSVVFINNEPSIFDVIIFDEDGLAYNDSCGENIENTLDEPCIELKINKTAIQRGRVSITNQFWTEHVVSRGKFREKTAVFTIPGNKQWAVDVIKHADGRHFFGGCKQMIEDLNILLDETILFKLENVPGLHFAICN